MAVEGDPFAHLALSAGNNPAAHAVAFVVQVAQGAFDFYGSVKGRGPAADDGFLRVVAGMAAVNIKKCVAKRRVGKLGGILPVAGVEVSEGMEFFDSLGGGIEPAVTILPGAESGRRRAAPFVLTFEKLFSELDFVFGRFALAAFCDREIPGVWFRC